MTKVHLARFLLTVCCVIVLAWFAVDGYSAEAPSSTKALRGPAFSEPGENHSIVTSKWNQKKIQYPREHQDVDLLITLDQNVYPVFKPFIDTFAAENKLTIKIIHGTCGITSGLLSRKQVDIGAYCCPPASSDRLPGMIFHSVGITPVALVVPKENPVNNVTMDEVRKIYSGAIKKWSELSDPAAKLVDKPITLITRLHCKIRPGHWRVILDHEDLFSPMINDLGSIEDVLMQTKSMRGIGFVAAWIADQKENRDNLKILRIDGFHPSDKRALASNQYPFYRSLAFTSWKAELANPVAGKLIGYIMKRLHEIEQTDKFFVSTKQLKMNKWQFHFDELIGEPGND